MKILQIGMHDQLGGIESFLMNYYRTIDRKQIQFDFIIPYKDGGYYDKEIKEMGGKIFYLSIKNDKNIFKFCRDLNNFFQKNHYDIVHCNDSGLGFFYLYFAKKNKIKIRIAHSHATNVEKGIKGIAKKILMKRYIELANVYFTCSTEAGNFLFPNKKFKIIKNGIDYERFKFDKDMREKIRNELNIQNTDILIGNIGRFCEQKNQIFLLEVLKKLDQKYKLILIGEGPLQQNFEMMIQQNNLSNRVRLLPPQKNIENFYNAFDIFCLSSLYEGLPIVGIEAQINGLPCIFNETISQEVIMNKNCMFIKNDLELWEKSITQCGIREKNISQEFNIKKNAIELESIYNKLLEEQVCLKY